MTDTLKELVVDDAAAWRRWLSREHERSPGVWLVLHKKGGRVTRLTYADALDEALCFGWIDGQLSTRDKESYRQRFTPRRPRSAWSARNVQHIERLAREGRIHASGRAVVERARADGKWNRAYAPSSKATVPEDLAQVLKEDTKARAAFESLSAANRYAILYRLETAKKLDTRARRLETCLQMLRRNETFHPQKKALKNRSPGG
jgi:uncharacterized protein YdeI (YjbR/CyaY-like superfamily)